MHSNFAIPSFWDRTSWSPCLLVSTNFAPWWCPLSQRPLYNSLHMLRTTSGSIMTTAKQHVYESELKKSPLIINRPTSEANTSGVYCPPACKRIGIKSPWLNSRFMNDQDSASGFTAIQFAQKIQKFCVSSEPGAASSVNKYNTLHWFLIWPSKFVSL